MAAATLVLYTEIFDLLNESDAGIEHMEMLHQLVHTACDMVYLIVEGACGFNAKPADVKVVEVALKALQRYVAYIKSN